MDLELERKLRMSKIDEVVGSLIVQSPELKKYFATGKFVKREFLTPNLKNLIDYVSFDAIDTPFESALLASLAYISQIGNLNRIKVKSSFITSKDGTKPANIYTFLMLDSGGGKDRPADTIRDNLLKDIYDQFYFRWERYKEKLAKEIERKEKSENENIDQREIRERIKLEMPGSFSHTDSDATKEGFFANRYFMYKAGFGGSFVYLGEFADAILSKNNSKEEFLNSLKEIWSSGDNFSKALKSDRTSRPAFGVPCTVLMHTSPSKLLEGVGRQRLIDFLNSGIARRVLMFAPQISVRKIDEDKFEEERQKRRERRETARTLWSQAQRDFYNLYGQTEKNNVFEMIQIGEDLLEDYSFHCYNRAAELDKFEHEGVIAELRGRTEKVLKIAALIQAFENPASKIISLECLLCAIHLVDVSGLHLKDFYYIEQPNDIEKVFEYMKNKNYWISKTDLR
jgi:hypothetical protein